MTSVEHFTKLYEDVIADRVAEDVKFDIAEELEIAKGFIKTLSRKIDELKRENEEPRNEWDCPTCGRPYQEVTK